MKSSGDPTITHGELATLAQQIAPQLSPSGMVLEVADSLFGEQDIPDGYRTKKNSYFPFISFSVFLFYGYSPSGLVLMRKDKRQLLTLIVGGNGVTCTLTMVHLLFHQ